MVEILAVSLADAAKMCGVGKSTLYKLVSQQVLNPKKVGKRTLFLVSDLKEFLNNAPTLNDQENSSSN